MTRSLPYGRHLIDEQDIESVTDVLRSDWLTTGPTVAEFEEAIADFCGARRAVAVSSGTAALHGAMYALGINEGDEVIVPAITFVATANAVIYQGGTPIFADVDRNTLLIDPGSVAEKISPRTKAVVAVDYAGQPSDYDSLRTITEEHDLVLAADACHSLGAKQKGRPVGKLADLTTLSFHPVKHIATGEGGMVVTNDAELSEKIRIFRNHGISSDHHQRSQQGSWLYEMVDLGYNYRITDFQCALGLSQLRKLPGWLARRREIAGVYDKYFAKTSGANPLVVLPDNEHAYHLYVVQLQLDQLKADRVTIFAAFREAGIGVNVHYIPVYLHPYYQSKFGTTKGLCPQAESAYESIITLPMWPGMSEADVDSVIETTDEIFAKYLK